MKLARFIILMTVVLSMSFCRKDNVENPTFDVRTERTEYAVGDSIVFNMSGYADIVTFYSGEEGYEYQYKDRTEYSGGALKLNFSSQVLYGTQENNLRLLYSTDFSGTYDATNVEAATWIDISDRFVWGTAAAGGLGTRTASGDVDISDIAVSGKPIYFAFKYVGQPNTSRTMRTWRIYDFNLMNELPNGNALTIATRPTAGWIAVDVADPSNVWTFSNATMIYFAPQGSLIYTEDWAITGALFPNKVSPDIATPIKSYLDTMKDFKYAFNSAGSYKVTFVATNANNNGISPVVKQLDITINE